MSRPPRIVACCGSMVVVFGLERMTFEVLGALRERGAAVHCIVNSWENWRIVALAEAMGATWSVGRYQESFDRHTRNPLRLARLLRDILETSFQLLVDARRTRPTHVLIPEFSTVLRNAPALVLLRLAGVEVLLRVGVAPSTGRFYRRLWRHAVAPLVSRLVANSNFTRRELLAYGIPPRKVTRVYNAVPSRTPAPAAPAPGPRDPAKVIYVGQIIPEKGVGVLLEAVAGLCGAGVEVRLDVVGPIDGWEPPARAGYWQRLIERAEEPDLAGRVRFLGWREDVPALMAGAAVHCCPSLPECREAFGLVVLEAKAAGLPTVGFRSGALPEIIQHRIDGWLCEDPSAEALAQGLSFFLEAPEALAAAGREARRSLARFSHEAFAERWRREFTQPPRRVLAFCNGASSLAEREPTAFEVLRTLAERGDLVHCIVPSRENERLVALAESLGASWSVGRYWLRDAWRFRPAAVLVPEPSNVLRHAPALLLRALGIRVVLRGEREWGRILG